MLEAQYPPLPRLNPDLPGRLLLSQSLFPGHHEYPVLVTLCIPIFFSSKDTVMWAELQRQDPRQAGLECQGRSLLRIQKISGSFLKALDPSRYL